MTKSFPPTSLVMYLQYISQVLTKRCINFFLFRRGNFVGYVIFIFKTNISSKRMCEAEPCLISRTQKKYLKTPF